MWYSTRQWKLTGTYEILTKDFSVLKKDYAEMAKDFSVLTKDYAEMEKEFSVLTKDYAVRKEFGQVSLLIIFLFYL